MADVADLPVKLGQEYRVKLGKSFTFPKENAYHTIKYDFKPLSVDTSKPGRLKVAEGDEVNVSLPVVQAESAGDVAQFRGPKKSCMKECVLIIDTQSGEASLEKISNTVQLKAVRDGRKVAPSGDRSVSPSPYPSLKAQSRPSSTGPPASGKQAATLQGGSKGQKPQAKSRTKSPRDMKSSSQPLPDQSKPRKKSRKAGSGNLSQSQTQPLSSFQPQQPLPNASALSMPTVGVGSATPEVSPIRSANPTPEPIPVPTKRIKVDSEQSSESSSSGSSGSSGSESDGEEANSHMPLSQTMATSTLGVPAQFLSQVPPVSQSSNPSTALPLVGQLYPGHVMQPVQGTVHQPQASSSSSSGSDSDSNSSSSSSGSSSDSSDQENDNEVAQAFGHKQPPRQRTMSQLRSDLDLSDSGSDSDS